MVHSVVLDHRLYVPLHLTGMHATNELFLGSKGIIAHLVNQMLVFDTILIPTMDFAIVPRITEWIGVDVLVHLLEEGGIRFIRRPSMLSYVGNGNGISMVKVQEASGVLFSKRKKAMWAPIDEAIACQFDVSGVDASLYNALIPLILDTTKEYNPSSNEVFIEQVEKQTYLDIISSEDLKASISHFEAVLAGDKSINLKNLLSVGPDQVQMVSYDSPINAAQVILQVAEANLQLLMAAESDATDLYTQSPTDLVLAERIMDAGAPSPRGEGTIRLVDLVGVPNIGSLVEAGVLSCSDVINLRESKAGTRFREWLVELDPTDPRDVERAIVDDLLYTSRLASPGSRIMRLVATIGLGLLNPFAGVASSVADGFVIEKLAKGWRPRVFLSQLQKLVEHPQ